METTMTMASMCAVEGVEGREGEEREGEGKEGREERGEDERHAPVPAQVKSSQRGPVFNPAKARASWARALAGVEEWSESEKPAQT